MSKDSIDMKITKRVLIVALFLMLLFSILILKYFILQVVEHEKWDREARLQHQRVVSEPFKRGLIYSNTDIKEGHPNISQSLVEDVQKFHLYIDPFQIPEFAKEEMAQTLGHMIGVASEDWKDFKGEFYRKSRSRKIALWLDFETKKEISAWWDHFAKKNKIVKNSLFFVDDYQRSYPFGSLLGQVLHTIRDAKDEITKEGVPTGGLEMQFNDLLKGKQGKRLLVHSPRNPLEMGKIISKPENGADLYLSINHYLQTIVEEEIAIGVKKCNAKCGWAILMDPYTGQIWAMGQYPFFDPANYRDFFNDKELIEHTKVKAITDANEIGSVMKPITLAIALMANEELQKEGKPALFTMDEKMATSNGVFPGRSRPLKDTHTHAYLNGYMAIQKSSNIYVAKIVDKIIKTLGNDWYRDKLETVFGFGQKTGIELPGEVAGLLPRIGKKHPSGALEWSLPTPYSLAMGHNIQATSLQILRAYAILANGGYFITPTLIKKIAKNEQILLDNSERAKIGNQLVDSKIVEVVTSAMKYTTKVGGTARRANIWGYTEAGKTGTAEKIVKGAYSKSHFFSSFIGFAPAKNPKFVLLVAIDEPEPKFIPGVGKNSQGGVCAAPIFREIGTRVLNYLGVPLDDPCGYPQGDPRFDREKADWIIETAKLTSLYESWNGK